MQIQIQIHSPGLRIETLLAEAALPELLAMVQKYRVEDDFPGMDVRPRRGKRWRRQADDDEVRADLDGAAEAVREEVKAFSSAKVLFQRVNPQTFPEKFLVLAAHHEAAATLDGSDPVFSGRHLVRTLVELGEVPPANPARDVQQAMAQGWLSSTGHRRLCVTNAGWHHLGEMLRGTDGVLV